MDYIKKAKELGFSNAAIMDTQKLVFKPEYRKFCEENQCGCYNVNPAGPYKHHSCMSAYCVDAQEMANAVGIAGWGYPIRTEKHSKYVVLNIVPE